MARSTKEGTGPGSSVDPSLELPSVEEVVKLTLIKAILWCEKLGIDCDAEELQTASQCKERLLQILKGKGIRGKRQPVRYCKVNLFLFWLERLGSIPSLRGSHMGALST
eukprot:m.11171 g.11171  ORF g.11171 m.11171 type:complete len:109 (+) comp23052_c0_seq2:99-425(+)